MKAKTPKLSRMGTATNDEAGYRTAQQSPKRLVASPLERSRQNIMAKIEKKLDKILDKAG